MWAIDGSGFIKIKKKTKQEMIEKVIEGEKIAMSSNNLTIVTTVFCHVS